MILKAPFPYFGGKSKVAPIVWDALGQPKHYIEPFFGSGAVLLNRPEFSPDKNYIETVNDKDGFIANLWRALQAEPEAVARVCDWPVNHADLSARRRWLIAREANLLENLTTDPDWYDVKAAGYWIWAASCWIGAGLRCINARPHLGCAGRGVHAIGKIPLLSCSGTGVHGMTSSIYDWFQALQARLRRVRVVCGDWERVCGGHWQTNQGHCGMFFDPPYGAKATRDPNLYNQESLTVADDVNAWVRERGADPLYRIVLAGYYEEHENLLSHGWTVIRWKAHGGYSNRNKDNQNKNREALFFSPHCVKTQEGFLR